MSGGDRLVQSNPQRQIVLDQISKLDRFVVANHPNFEADFNHCPIERLMEWNGLAGMEIFNGIIGRLQGSPYATDKWDILLSSGRRLWGFANDDCHGAGGDVAVGWNTADVVDASPRGVVDALARGCFYASTGVNISAIEVDVLHIRIQTDGARRIVALTDSGSRLAVVDDSAIEIDVPSKATYVRFDCWGDGERFAWTQPFCVE
jgi:hypothetical protein